jgi:flagellar motor switch protein FliN/FliY
MSTLMEENIEAVLTACAENSAALGDALSQCFDRSFRIVAGDSGVWSAEEPPAEFRGPGLIAIVEAESQALAVLIPESLPLPEWYRHPSEAQAARLETLAGNWSTQLIPNTSPASRSRIFAVDDLAAAASRMRPADWATTSTLQVFDAAGSAETPTANLLIVWPLDQPEFAPRGEPAVTAAKAPPMGSVPRQSAHDPLARLRRLPVQVSVRLVEKKIPMSQLLGIAPGMLITFNKSCDDLLDLFVNNARYCRGEAVKIGENFGLKINQLGMADDPQRKVIDAGR